MSSPLPAMASVDATTVSVQRAVWPAPLPTLVTVQPIVTATGSPMPSVGADTPDTASCAYGASATVSGADATLFASAFSSRT